MHRTPGGHPDHDPANHAHGDHEHASHPCPDHGHDHDHEHGHHHGPEAPSGPKQPGIILASFGTAVTEARQAYESFAAAVRRRFPDIPVAWAYTAHKVRRRLAAQGLDHDCVATALSRMHDQKVTHLAVQSLHTVPGVEYFWTLNLAKAYEHPRKGFHKVCLGSPLLHEDVDLDRALACLSDYIPAQRTPDEAVILVGHGTYHAGQQRYLDFEARIREQDPLLFMGLLMGEPGLPSLIQRLHQARVATVWLLPFMAVSGHHVRKDMFGNHGGSWQKQLQQAGFQVRGHIAGTIESPCFQNIWLDHLETALAGLRLTEAEPCPMPRGQIQTGTREKQ